jgi:hypothetical protein
MAVHVYTGPTLSADEVRTILPDAEIHDPVRHGDLLSRTFGPRDTVVLIDGYYHTTASVRHKEILDVLDTGVSVIGCASMGALRAAELHPYGMQGWGRVFEFYRDGVIDGDDEVAVLHSEEAPFRRVSEPLVNIRHAVALFLSDDEETAAGVIGCIQRLPFHNRSWPGMELAIKNTEPELLPAWECVREGSRRAPADIDIKATDARGALKSLVSCPPSASKNKNDVWRADGSWRTPLLGEWQARFRGRWVDDVFVSEASVLRYLQIFTADFPRRWTKFACRAMPEGAADDLSIARLSPTQRAYWLTPSELRGLTPADQNATILMRSFRAPGGLKDMVDDPLLMDEAERVVETVAEACAINQVVCEENPSQRTDRLNYAQLANALMAIWRIDGLEQTAADAAARDRGFTDFADAVEAYRDFHLHELLLGSFSGLPEEV